MSGGGPGATGAPGSPPGPPWTLRHVAAQVTGRLLLEAPAGGGPFPWLVGFHGYGEDAAALERQLLQLPGTETWVHCAVQALHPFYNTKTGDVVASWMTKQDREQAIRDNLDYVGRALTALEAELGAPRRLVFVGFSQGVAMAYRAAAAFPCQGLVALAGDLPPEVAAEGVERLPATLLGRGRGDEWYTAAKLGADAAALIAGGVPVETVEFAGAHEWTAEFRTKVGEWLSAGAAA